MQTLIHNTFEITRPCTASDLFAVTGGLQCGNCGAHNAPSFPTCTAKTGTTPTSVCPLPNDGPDGLCWIHRAQRMPIVRRVVCPHCHAPVGAPCTFTELPDQFGREMRSYHDAREEAAHPSAKRYYFGLPTCCGETMQQNQSETRGYPEAWHCRECGEETSRDAYENAQQDAAERAAERAADRHHSY